MSLPPQKFREIILQILYSHDISETSQDEIISFMMHQLSVSKKNVREAWNKAMLILEDKEVIDNHIGDISTAYQFERIQKVEKSILRLSVYDLLHNKGIPPKVTISEGMRLAKKFASPEAANFVNAILDGIYKKMSGESVDNEKIETAFEHLLESEKQNPIEE